MGRITEFVSVSSTPVMVEPAGIDPAISNATSARRIELLICELRPANIAEPAPLLREPAGSW